MTNNDIVQKLWNLCDILRDDGINYSDYVTELVLLLFIKMAHENKKSGILKTHPLPEGCRWSDINGKSGVNLLNDYKRILLSLSNGVDVEGKRVHADPLITAIYTNVQTRLREPRHLEKMIRTLDQINWSNSSKDGLGDLYEGLLEKNASETKSGAGQYFTPRALINSIVRCIKPRTGEVIQDPATGTAGFLVAANQYMREQTNDYHDLSEKEAYFQKKKAFVGIELVPNTRRLALMNCLLHGMEGDNAGVVHLGNTLGKVGQELESADIILANPPFGSSKGPETNEPRDDLNFDTSNKQLLFLQHIYLNLKPGGRAAVVLPDNVLFEMGIATKVRQDLMNKCNLHTILRLPTGIFYAQGVRTNVLFFTKGSAENSRQEIDCTKNVWVYDLRTNLPSFGKRRPFEESDLAGFEAVYAPKNVTGDNFADVLALREEDEYSVNAKDIFIDKECASRNKNLDEKLLHSRWRCFSREWIRGTKSDSLDISWLKDKDSIDVASLPAPEILALEAKESLEAALSELGGLLAALKGTDE